MTVIMRKKDKAVKFDGRGSFKEKLRFDLLPVDALIEVVKIYNYGAKKYPSDRNWEGGLFWSRVFGSLQRHSWAFWNGEDLDKESGLSHLAHAAWCCLALLEYARTKRCYDDRPKKKKTKS